MFEWNENQLTNRLHGKYYLYFVRIYHNDSVARNIHIDFGVTERKKCHPFDSYSSVLSGSGNEK